MSSYYHSGKGESKDDCVQNKEFIQPSAFSGSFNGGSKKMLGLGTPEILLILLIIVIVFGVGKLPEVGSGMGRAIRNFKKAMHETETDIDTAANKELKK